MVNNKFSFILKNIIFEDESIFYSIKKDIQNIDDQFKKFNSKDVPSDFIKLWQHYIKKMNSNVDKYEVDKLIENIKELKKSYILNWSLPHKKLEKIINYKNILLNDLLNKISIVKDGYIKGDFSNLPYERSSYLTNLYEENDLSEPTLIEQINEIIESLKKYNKDKLVKEFILFWEESKKEIKDKIQNDQLEEKDIRRIQDLLKEVTISLNFYFTIPHKQLQDLLNILNFQNKYIFIFKN
jgi:hypothetical protein